MKKLISAAITAAALSMSLSTSGFAAEGAGVGNGEDGDRARYISQLKRELGINSGREMVGAAHLYDWCSRVSHVLRRELRRAERLVRRSDMMAAKNVLQDALIAASESLELEPGKAAPYTKKLVDRGVYYALYIDQLPEHRYSSGLNINTQLLFLTNYMDFIIKTERELDRPHYIPYYYEHGDCGRNGRRCRGSRFDFDAYQRRYIQAAKDELGFLNDLTDDVYQDGYRYRYALGNPHAFLRIAEGMTLFVAEDLRDNVYAVRNACEVVDLMFLHQTLSDFNQQGDTTYFESAEQAVDETSRTAHDIASSLSPSSSSCSWNRYHDDDYDHGRGTRRDY